LIAVPREFEESFGSMLEYPHVSAAILMESNSAAPFDTEGYLRRQASIIDGALEVQLARYPGESQTLFEALRYGVFSGGKRIRPILTLAAGEIFRADAKHVLPFACAVELIHAYSLIHDDLPALDNDELRRGKPTAHKVYGEGMALLAGDALLTEAFRIMADAQSARDLAPELILDGIRELAQAAGALGLVGGQAFDLEAEETDVVDLPMVEMIHVRKTGALILASVRIGARLGGASEGELARLSRYGEYLGLAFQIADDILDANAGVAVEERAESSRMEQKKATYPSVVGLVTARERLAELLQLSLRELDCFALRGQPLAAIARYIVGRAIHLDDAQSK
jgi:geranylgeranyl diphosphate synthase type II